MNPIFNNIGPLTFPIILGSEENCISFLQEIDLLPKKGDAFCKKCGKKLMMCKDPKRKMGWRYKCKCGSSLSPLSNTFFEHVSIPFSDILAIIFDFVWKTSVIECWKKVCHRREVRGQKPIDKSTVIHFYSQCMKVCETYAVHKRTNHSIGELVSKDDTNDITNSLENENKKLKHSLTSRCNEEHIRQGKDVLFYRRCRLQKELSYGEKVFNFLQDLREVYPGPFKEGKKLLEFDMPTPESEGIEQHIPPQKRPRTEAEDQPEDENVPFIDDTVNDPN